MSKIYDYIIYGAGLSGVTASLFFAKREKKVLLLNHYGFTGGRITESLNLFQHAENLPESIAKNIYENLYETHDSFLFSSKDKFVVNPESVKIVLQEFLEKEKIDLLFHVTPVEINSEENICLILSGKEGRIEVKGKTVIDTSANFAVIGINEQLQIESVGINLITSKLNDDSFSKNESVQKYSRLSDGRYFISLKPVSTPNLYLYENEIQQVINDFEKYLQSLGGRIQLIAPQADVLYKTDVLVKQNIFHVDSFIKKYSKEEEFIQAAEFENHLGELL